MDKDQLEQELEKLHAASFGWALWCCGRDQTEAEDVLQMTYLKILQGKAQFHGKSTLKTWLFALIRRTAAENRRRNFVRRLRLGEFFRRQPPAVTRTETGAQLLQLLSVLPYRQREVLELVFCHDLSIEDAARVMGVSVGTARTHYERGKKRIRDRFVRGEFR